HRNGPFFAYYSMSHMHIPMLRTPDSTTDRKDYWPDNIAYMDKLVGKLVAELDRLGLRENTLVVFAGDNGTTPDRFTVNGRPLSTWGGSLSESAVRVPLIVNWPGTTPPSQFCHHLIDFSDFFPTFAELAGLKLAEGITIDGHSFAPQILGRQK